MIDPSEKENKLRDIRNIHYGDDVREITTSMEIVLTFYEFDDDKEIIEACKAKIAEGCERLKELGAQDLLDDIGC